MKSTQIINFFENLAINAHHNVAIDSLLANQNDDLKRIYLLKDAEYIKSYFSQSEYFADSVKVAEF